VARFGVDYSTGPPTVQELKDAAVTFVGRYVSKPGAAKNLTLAEAERFAYLDGAAAEIGRDNVGIYGGRLAIDKALGAGNARWGWQTRSWSDGWSDKAHVRQFEHDLKLGRGRIDKNRAMTKDFGQWRVREDMPLNDADKKWLLKEIRDAVNDHANTLFRWADHGGTKATPAPTNHPHNHKKILERLDEINGRLK
jgi:hypothetical protein